MIVIGPVFLRKVKAKWLLLVWFVSQLGLTNSQVAWMAHVGGFVFGAAVGWLWRHRDRQLPIPAPIGA
jgi:membrane associated rhomboid family serine protease